LTRDPSPLTFSPFEEGGDVVVEVETPDDEVELFVKVPCPLLLLLLRAVKKLC
jgi:hypothetical protein